ncbi:MAG: APC family permease [Phycisphaerales bacterium]|nr:APC family permease [Phycisphaerales bacterium]
MPAAPSDRYRVIGPAGAVGVIVASTVGSGIFSVTGQFGAQVGSDTNVIVPWVLGGIVALCGGLSLAELGAMIPCSGGSVEFARRAFGPRVGYLVAMVTILAGHVFALAVVSLFMAEFVQRIMPSGWPNHAIAACAIAVAWASQLPSLRAGFAFNTALAAVKVATVAAFAVGGLLVPVEGRLAAPAGAPAPPGLLSPAVAAATLAVSFAYLGWSTGADIAGEVRDPGRNVPRAIIRAICIVFLLYVGVNLAFLRAIDPAAMTNGNGGPMEAIGSVAAGILFGPQVGAAMTGLIALLLFSTLVSSTIAGTRIMESMAQAHELPAWIAVRPTRGVPARAIALLAAAGIASLAIGSLGQILDLLTVLVNAFSALSVAAVIVLRRTMPDAPRPFRVPLYPVTPLLYMALAGWTIVAGAIAAGERALVASAATIVVLLAMRPLLRGRRLTTSGSSAPGTPPAGG